MHPVARNKQAQRAGPINHRCCPLPSEVSRYAGLYLVSVASLPHHLQATHLVFRPTLAEPKHFLLVTQPPRRAEGTERERKRIDEGKRERKLASERTHHGIFPSFPPCSALVWSDSSSARPKRDLLPRLCIARYSRSSYHSPLTLLDSFFSVNFFGKVAENIWTLCTFPIRLLIMWFVYIIKGQHFYGRCDSCWFFCFQSRLSGWIFFSWTVGLAKSFTVWLWAGVGNYHTHSPPFISHSLTLFSYSCLSGLTFTVPPLS